MAKHPAIKQPKFDPRIYSLRYPLDTGDGGSLKRGFMIWEKPITGYSDRAVVHFLYNPSSVTASYTMGDANVQASLLYPNPNDNADLRVPLYQSSSWTLLFDRTYELWGQYNPQGKPVQDIGQDFNNPSVVGVLADVMQMRQFTGMSVGFNPNARGNKGQQQPPTDTFVGGQGLLNLITSFVFFGDKNNLSFYGYISEWDFTITHFTQNMVPMRAVIDVTFTMLPTPKHVTTPGSTGSTHWSGLPTQGPGPRPASIILSPDISAFATTSRSGISGR